jgi:hypothetical protein
MNCSPFVEGKTANAETCYTPDILKKIRDSYNKSHPDEKILAKTPNEIWHSLKSRLSTCSKEDCWLKEIKDTQMQRDLDTYVFAPDRPPTWTKSPNEWLSNIDILAVLRQYDKKHRDFKFMGPTPIDFDTRPVEDGGKCVWQELCTFDLAKYVKQGITSFGIIFNLDKHDEGGSHWVSLYISVKKNPFAFFFDSAGSPAPAEVNALVSRIQEQWKTMDSSAPALRFIQNAPHIHQYSNTECGMYSLIFIVTMLTGKSPRLRKKEAGGSSRRNLSLSRRNLSLGERFDLFLRGKITDKEAATYRNIYFNAP